MAQDWIPDIQTSLLLKKKPKSKPAQPFNVAKAAQISSKATYVKKNASALEEHLKELILNNMGGACWGISSSFISLPSWTNIKVKAYAINTGFLNHHQINNIKTNPLQQQLTWRSVAKKKEINRKKTQQRKALANKSPQSHPRLRNGLQQTGNAGTGSCKAHQ